MGAAKKLAIGIPIAIVVIVVGLFAYSYTQINVSLNDASFDSIDWNFSGSSLLNAGFIVLTGNLLEAAFEIIDGININLFFGLSNGGLLPVYIPDISYDLFINEIPMGTGKSQINETILPGQTKEIVSLQNFKKNSLAPAVFSIVDTGGIMDLKVSGTAYFDLFGLNIPVPFESTKQISIGDEIRKYFES